MLVDGKWTENWQPIQAKDDKGRFVRQPSSFRNWVTPDGSAGPSGGDGFAAEADRYHLYVALTCPWACRTLMLRKLKKLDDVISYSVVDPRLSDRGWRFSGYPGAAARGLNGETYLHEAYTAADAHYTGRVTVPVLWDRKRGTVVNNESADIVRMFNSAFDQWGDADLDLYPATLRGDIDALNDRLYTLLNNGVYKAGFAQTQEAYEEAVEGVFAMLDDLEAQLSDGRPFLFGAQLTETDVRAFVTLIRFDAAYHGLFKCNLRAIGDYPHLAAYTARMLHLPGIAETVDIAHIKAGYYSIKAVNPTGIVPVGPRLDYLGSVR